MAEKETGFLGYNDRNGRFGILSDMDLWVDDGLHCGELVEVRVNDKWMVDRIELSDEWYLVYSKLKGDELEHLRVRY